MSKKRKENSSLRCVLKLQLLPEVWQEHILEKRFRILETMQNELIRVELNRFKTLEQDPEYKSVTHQLQELSKRSRHAGVAVVNTNNGNETKSLYKKRQELLFAAGFTEYTFAADMMAIQKRFVEHIATHIASMAARDVWRSFERFLYGRGKSLPHEKKASVVCAANKTPTVSMSYRDNTFFWNGGRCEHTINLAIPVEKPATEYEREMLEKPIRCYRVVRYWSKTKYKYYLHIVLEGAPVSKARTISPGRVGIYVHGHRVAICSDSQALVVNLPSALSDSAADTIQRLKRKIESSLRTTNPDKYSNCGTLICPQNTLWRKSSHCKAYEAKIREIKRHEWEKRRYEHTVFANYILSLGTEIYLCEATASSNSIRSNFVTPQSKNGKKTPALFIKILESKLSTLEHTGLQRINASALQQRSYPSGNEELYAAYLLFNTDPETGAPGKVESINSTNFTDLLNASKTISLSQAIFVDKTL